MRLCGLQGWQTERVVQRNASSGRILLVLPHDPAAHQRKARPFSCVPARPMQLPGRPCMCTYSSLRRMVVIGNSWAHMRARFSGTK